MMISIIIPVLNEENIIQNTLQQFIDKFPDSDRLEIIIIDGGSQDRTREIVTQFSLENSLENKQIKLITESDSGRANQMNYGAALATENILLFLHADTILPNNYQQIIPKILLQKNAILGAFQLKIDGQEQSLRWVEKMVNLRSRFLSLPYGDQGFFITKQNFNLLGGFTNLPSMEDFNLIQKAKRHGKIIMAKQAVITSARRWQKLGIFKTTTINQLIIIGYYLKIPTKKLKNFYSSQAKS
jgi:rSAM/selenodomain-associated transferase 2